MKDRNSKIFKTRYEIALEFGISYRTLLRRIKLNDLNISPGLLNIEEQKEIYDLILKNGMELSHHNRNYNVS